MFMYTEGLMENTTFVALLTIMGTLSGALAGQGWTHYLTTKREAVQRAYEERLQYRPLRLALYKAFISSMKKADLEEGPVLERESMLLITDEIIPEIKLIATKPVSSASVDYFNAETEVMGEGIRNLGADDITERDSQKIAVAMSLERKFVAAAREELCVPSSHHRESVQPG
jgi:hypothetical protein